MSVTSTARVVTDRGERYRKQLASHFGNRIEVTESPPRALDQVEDVTRTWSASARRTGSSLPGCSLPYRIWSGPDDIL